MVRQAEAVLVEVVRAGLDAARDAADQAVPTQAVARYVVGAYLALLEWWLDASPRLTPEEADRIFHILVAPGIRTALRPAPPR